jgi:putative transposase
VNYEELSPYPQVRMRKWAEKVHTPLDDARLAAIRRSSATGLPLGDAAWVKRLARRLNLDLTIRPRGRPAKRQQADHQK